jgi:hypothetical protein
VRAVFVYQLAKDLLPLKFANKHPHPTQVASKWIWLQVYKLTQIDKKMFHIFLKTLRTLT